MSLAQLMADDYLVWENLEEIRVYPGPRLDSSSFDVLAAKRRAVTTSDLIRGNGAYTGSDLVWLIPAAALTQAPYGYEPKPGDVFEDQAGDPNGAVDWTVIGPAAKNKLGQTFRVVCRSLALNANLADSITILRPAITVGPAAEPVYDWTSATAIVTGIACRVQPEQASVETHNDVEASANRYSVVLGQQVALQKDDRFQATIAATSEVILLQWTVHRNAEKLDELPLISCVRVG